MNIEIKMLGPSDANVLRNVHPDVFDYDIDSQWSEEFLQDPRHHIVVALDNVVVVGMATAVDYVHPDKPVELWINEVGVASNYQSKGIGKTLIQTLLDFAKELGCQQAWVATEILNKKAQRLYADLDGQADMFLMYTFEL